MLITGTENADSINNTLSGATINALGGDDSVINDGANVLAELGRLERFNERRHR